MLNYSVRSYIV